MQRHQRDGAAWFSEWMCLPQIVLGTASATQIAADLCASLQPEPAQMAQALTGGLQMIHAEALSFALAAQMRRPEAQSVVKALCREAQETNANLSELVKRDWPDLDASLFDPARQMGAAPDNACSFASAVAALGTT